MDGEVLLIEKKMAKFMGHKVREYWLGDEFLGLVFCDDEGDFDVIDFYYPKSSYDLMMKIVDKN